MTETGLLIAQVVFLVLLFAFIASVVRSSSRQLGRTQPPQIINAGPVVDQPRAPAAPAPPEPAPAVSPEPVAAPVFAPAVAEPALAEPATEPAEVHQPTLEPFPSPFHVPPAEVPAPDAPEDVAPPAQPATVTDAALIAAVGADEPADDGPDILARVAEDRMDLTANIRPRLQVESSPALEVGSDLELEGGLTIGRSGAADLSLADQYVSHMHARILRRGDYYFVEDLGSTNGTFLNDNRVEKSAQLKVHDTLRMGQTVLRYEE